METIAEKTVVQQLAAKKGMMFYEFAGYCLLEQLSYDTARELWYGADKVRGYNRITKKAVAAVLETSIEEIFGQE